MYYDCVQMAIGWRGHVTLSTSVILMEGGPINVLLSRLGRKDVTAYEL